MEIKNAVVLVTGASSGIGAATARAASRGGAKLTLLARRADRIQALAAELGNTIAVSCDATDRRQVQDAFRIGMVAYGRIDVLLNTAGQGFRDRSRAQIPMTSVQSVVAPLITMQTVLPIMRRQWSGSIVNVSSGVTCSALPETGAYSASKAALNKLSAIARKEAADRGISVSTLYPFIAKTEFITLQRAGHESALKQAALHRIG